MPALFSKSVQQFIERFGFPLVVALLVMSGMVAMWSADRKDRQVEIDRAYKIADQSHDDMMHMLSTETGLMTDLNGVAKEILDANKQNGDKIERAIDAIERHDRRGDKKEHAEVDAPPDKRGTLVSAVPHGQ